MLVTSTSTYLSVLCTVNPLPFVRQQWQQQPQDCRRNSPSAGAYDTAQAEALLAWPGLEPRGAAVLGVLAEARMQLRGLPLGPQEVVNSVLYRKVPSDVLESNFLVLFRAEQLKHTEQPN